MIIGMGCDICDVDALRRKSAIDEELLESIFTSKEIAYCISKRYPSRHFAARFAAKESLFKALGSGAPTPGAFKEVEITRDKAGAPGLCATGRTLEQLNKLGISKIFVTLSHTAKSAFAVVIIEK